MLTHCGFAHDKGESFCSSPKAAVPFSSSQYIFPYNGKKNPQTWDCQIFREAGNPGFYVKPPNFYFLAINSKLKAWSKPKKTHLQPHRPQEPPTVTSDGCGHVCNRDGLIIAIPQIFVSSFPCRTQHEKRKISNLSVSESHPILQV